MRRAKMSIPKDRFPDPQDDFNSKLKDFHEIWFYYNPVRFHPPIQKVVGKQFLER